MQHNYWEILDSIISLLERYSLEKRATVEPVRYLARLKDNPNYTFFPEDQLIRESLMEHVWYLPVIATFFHPFIESQVNLGRALEMLAVHDIWELAIWDEIVFNKKEDKENRETTEALKLLHPSQHEIYLEFKNQTTLDAKYAKTIDKITPDIFDYVCDKDMTCQRLKHFANFEKHDIAPTIEKFKSPYMQWDPFFKGFHAHLMWKIREKFTD